MLHRSLVRTAEGLAIVLVLASPGFLPAPARADGNLQNLKHIIIVTQENHSFDNYLGALPYASNSPYHEGFLGCDKDDHDCVDGLSCIRLFNGRLACFNFNFDDDGGVVFAFHEKKYCTGPDLDHSWVGSHKEANFLFPNAALLLSFNNGFVRQNDATEQLDNGNESPTDDDTMGFYRETDLPFYYGAAETFAIDDHYFCPVVGPTFPNRSYEMAATSFGHLTTNEIFPPGTGYKPITGTIFDLLDANGVNWVNYFVDLPTSGIFRAFLSPHLAPVSVFLAQAATGTLPPVSIVDPSFFPDQTINGVANLETDEHPPNDVRAGEFVVSQVVNAVRNGPEWQDSLILITYDEHGGFYDHVAPPRAPQAGALNPDGINPGQCEDLSNPPASEQPGGGANCTFSQTVDAPGLCPAFTPTGPYPANCANFNQLGFRVPFIAISPFSKPHYVSHTVGDHTSILALIEDRFLPPGSHLTLRDQNANPLLDMFDFDDSPSLNASVPTAPPPTATDPGCPFVP